MCNYFLLRRQSDPHVLGVKNGIKQAEIKRSGFSDPAKFDFLKDVLGSNNYWGVKDTIGDLEVELQYVELLTEAKLTDFLQFGPALINCPFLISEKVSSIFNQFKISNCSLFPATVVNRVQKSTYYLSHFARESDDIIDFSRTVFYTGNHITKKRKYTFFSKKEKNIFHKENISLKPERIYLRDTFDSSLDLFVMSDGEMVVSENLKIELIRSECYSGVKFLPAFGEDLQWVSIHH
jgi:hypothetical protein